MFLSPTTTFVSVTLVLAVLAACGGDAGAIKDPNAGGNPTPQDTSGVASTTAANAPAEIAPAAAPPAPEKLADDQILGAIHTANQAEIEQGKLAKSKGKDAKVKRYAAMMVKHHSEAEAKAVAIGKKNALAMTATPASTGLASDTRDLTSAMSAQAGAAFDKAYVDAQVKEHQSMIELIDKRLMPSAQAPDVKAYVDAVRTRTAQHLTDARELQAKL